MDFLIVDRYRVPVRNSRTNQQRSQVAITRSGIRLRISKYLSKSQKEETINNLLRWAEQTLRNGDIAYAEQWLPPTNSEIQLTILGTPWKLTVLPSLSTDKARISIFRQSSQTLIVQIPAQFNRNQMNRALSSYFIPIFYDQVWQILQNLNNRFTKAPLGNLNLRYTTSRWGSCSSLGNISLSSRLLLAPLPILEAVMVHELVHLEIKNHSLDFHKRVEEFLPEIKQQEHWLQMHGPNLNFC